MKPRQHLLNLISGKEADSFSWSPNVAYWWEAQSEDFVKHGEVEFLESIGAAPLIRGHYPMTSKKWENVFLFREEYIGCSKEEKVNGDKKRIIYTTPVGKLEFDYVFSPLGNTWFLVGHGVTTEEDFKTLIYLKSHAKIMPDFERFCEISRFYGDRCLILPIIVPEKKSAFQAMLEYWVGMENLAYAVADYPELVEEALAVMREVNLRAVKASIETEAQAFITWEDSSSTNVSPQWYERYISPEINSWCDIIHGADKLYIQHACGLLKNLIPVIKNTKVDAIESMSPPPTGDIELWEAREQLPNRIFLIGGLEATHFEGLRGVNFENYIRALLDKMSGKSYILANSDSCPPGVPLENYIAVGQIINAWQSVR